MKNGNARELTVEEKNQGKVAIPRYLVREEEVVKKLEKPVKFFVGSGNITNSTNERIIISSLLPFTAIGGKIILTLINQYEIQFLTNLNSFVFDFTAR